MNVLSDCRRTSFRGGPVDLPGHPLFLGLVDLEFVVYLFYVLFNVFYKDYFKYCGSL